MKLQIKPMDICEKKILKNRAQTDQRQEGVNTAQTGCLLGGRGNGVSNDLRRGSGQDRKLPPLRFPLTPNVAENESINETGGRR